MTNTSPSRRQMRKSRGLRTVFPRARARLSAKCQEKTPSPNSERGVCPTSLLREAASRLAVGISTS